MSIFTQVAAAVAWPVSRIKRRGKEEGDPLQNDGEAVEPQQNDSGTEGDAAGLPNMAAGSGTFEQTNAASSAAAVAGAGPTPQTAAPGQPPLPAPGPEASATPPQKSDIQKDDILQLFTEDMAGNEDMKRLEPFLKEVSVYDLADECRSVAMALQKQ